MNETNKKNARVYDKRTNKTLFTGTTKECLGYLKTKKGDEDYSFYYIADISTEKLFDEWKEEEELSKKLAELIMVSTRLDFDQWADENVPSHLKDGLKLAGILKDAIELVKERKNITIQRAD
jgi:hypothetical protein